MEQSILNTSHLRQIRKIYSNSVDADEFAVLASKYCFNHKELKWIANQLQDFIVIKKYNVTKDQIYEFVEEQLAYIDDD